MLVLFYHHLKKEPVSGNDDHEADMKHGIRRINIWSLIKTSFLINTILGIVLAFSFGVLVMILGAAALGDMSNGLADIMSGMEPGIMVLVFAVLFLTPIIIIFLTISQILCGVLYNLIAGFTGGVEIELTNINDKITENKNSNNKLSVPPSPILSSPPIPPPSQTDTKDNTPPDDLGTTLS